MEEIKNIMIKEAKKRHKKIYPCARMKNLDECFTKSRDILFFWYNTEDNSTHVITKEIKPKN
ncbi:MAG: hypothetical protein N2053_11040 [Chitinispirillaceae bacterium]|nr:hypothetical protein [Chitinispirillaceae bacterium]